MRRIEEVERAFREFADQGDATVLIVRSFDSELVPVAQALQQIDGTPHFVYADITPAGGDLTSYVNTVIASLLIEVESVRGEQSEEDASLLSEFPEACWSPTVEPLLRLRLALAHLASYLPEDDETHLIVALLPSAIENHHVHAQVVGSLLPHVNFEPWMARVRFILRDDKENGFITSGALHARLPGVVLFETHLAIPDIVDELLEDGANTELQPGQRIQAILQCAIVEVTLGRLKEAMAKLSRLYAYYCAYNVPEMQGLVLLQVAEAFRQANAMDRSHRCLVAAVAHATQHEDIMLMLNSTYALACHGASVGNHAEVEMACAVGSIAARLLSFDDLYVDFLLRRGDACAAQGNLAGALSVWTECVNDTRQMGNREMLVCALSRLRDYAWRTGHRDIGNQYATEIREYETRIQEGAAT